MTQVIGLICTSIFFVLGADIVKRYFKIEIKHKVNNAFFLLICVAVCEAVYGSVYMGTVYNGNLFEYIPETSGVYDFVCSNLGKLIYGKTEIVKLMLGTFCLGLVLGEFESILFYPFVFLCFKESGAVLLFAVLAMKYSDRLKPSLLFALCAVILDFRAAITVIYIILRHTKPKNYAIYFYGAAALIVGGLFGRYDLFAPAYAYAVDRINDKYIKTAVKTVSVVFMGYNLIQMFSAF